MAFSVFFYNIYLKVSFWNIEKCSSEIFPLVSTFKTPSTILRFFNMYAIYSYFTKEVERQTQNDIYSLHSFLAIFFFNLLKKFFFTDF